MDPGAWAAYGQHYQRLGGGGVNPSAGPLGHQSQLNDLSLSAGLPRQDGISGYGGSGPPLLLSHHGLNVAQGSHHGDSAAASFVSSAGLLSSGYDPMISATFQSSAKGHLPPLNVGPHSAGLYKAMSGKESEMGDLRVGFGRRGLAQAMATDPNMGMTGSPGIFNHQAPPHSWRHSNMVPTPTSSPFGVLPHEAILPRANTMEKLHSQDHRSKSSRMMMDAGRYMESELSAHSYRNVLSAAQGRSTTSIMDHNPSSRGSIMVQQSSDSLVGPSAESLGLTSLKSSDYSLYANSNVNARGLLSQNYMSQAHFSSAPELQNEKRDLYDLSLVGDKIENYTGVVTSSKSHLDLFGSNSHTVNVSGGSNSGSNLHPSVNQSSAPVSSSRSSHRSSSGSSGSQSHNRPMCSSQASPQVRATTHSSSYPTFSPTSTVANYSHSYQASPQPSPSHQQIHSPAHYSSPVAVDFTNTVPAHSAPPPPPQPSSSNYPSSTSVLTHNDGTNAVAYSSVITRATASSGSYATSLMSNKVMSSKQQHLPPNESSKHPTPTASPLQPLPPPPPPPPALVRPYEPVIRTPDITNTENCMGELVPTNLTIPTGGVMSRGTPNSNPNSVNPNGSNSGGSSSLPPLDHNLIHSPAMTPVPPPSAGRTSADNSSSCHSPIINKSITMDSVFNPQQMTLQDLAEMSSSNDKIDLEGGGSVSLMQHHKESLVNDEQNLMDLSQNPHHHHHHHHLGSNVLGHLGTQTHHQLKILEKKKKKSKKRKRHMQDEEGAVDVNGGATPLSSQPPMIPLNLPPPNVQQQPASSASLVQVQPMPPNSMCPSPRVNQMYSSGPPSCSSRPPCMSPLVGVPSSPNYIGGGPNIYERTSQQSQPPSVESCRESGNGRFGQNGSIVEEMTHHHHVQDPEIPPASPPLASLFDPLPTSPQGNAEAAAFEEKLRNEASQIAKKKLDRRGPSIEDDLGFLAELPPACNVTCEKRKLDVGLKPHNLGSSNFIDSFLNFLKEGDSSTNQSDGSSSSAGKGQGRGRGRKKETYTTPPLGKKVELNPETGLFTCKQKSKNLQLRESDAQQAQVQQNKFTGSIKKVKNESQEFQLKKLYGSSLNISNDGAQQTTTNPNFTMNSESGPPGMANQGFVDSVKMALQSLSDNEGYEAGVDEPPCTWNEYNQSATNVNTHCQWGDQKNNQNTTTTPTSAINSNNNDCAVKANAQRNAKEKWDTGDPNQLNSGLNDCAAESGESIENAGNSDSNEKEFYNFSLPRRESSMRKCKEKMMQKRKEKFDQGTDQLNENDSSESDDEKQEPSSDPVWIPQNRGLGLMSSEMQWKQQQQQQSQLSPSMQRSPGLRGRRKGRPPNNPNSTPRGRPPNKRVVTSEIINLGEPVKKPRGRGRPRLSDYVDNNDHHENVVKETAFKRGEFLILLTDKCRTDPPLWLVESHGLLKKFEVFKEQERVLYRMTMFPSVKMESKSLYETVSVSLVRNDRNSPIIEYVRDRHRTLPNLHSSVSSSGSVPNSSLMSSRSLVQEDLEAIAQKDNFEVYLQTLISQVLDSNFISEIVKENDEYFLSHVHEIDGIVLRRKNQLARKIPWNTAMKDCADHFPTVIVRPFTAEGGVKLMCQACAKECMSLWKIAFEGQLYDDVTLSPLRSFPVGKKLDEREFLLCSNCMDMVQAYSHMHHQKHNLFVMCANKVNSIRSSDPSRESHVILEQCLQDASWIQKLFCKIKSVWGACAVLCR